MKHLKSFKLHEGIINYETDNIKSFYDELISKYDTVKSLTLDEIKSVGDEYDIEVVDYSTFYKELPDDEMRKSAPPKHAPCLALVNPVSRKARIIINVPKVDKGMFEHIYHMLKHENVHIGQYERSGGKGGEGMDVTNRKKFFSNKEEVMAFSQSIVDMLMKSNPKTKQSAFDKLKFNPLWNDIKSSVDVDILQRYKKYIYLYLDKEFKKNKE